MAEVVREATAAYLTRASVDHELAFLDDVHRDAYHLAQMTGDDIAAARELVHRYRELELGVADASLLVLCDRHDTGNVLTLDRRHFLATTSRSGRTLALAPSEAVSGAGAVGRLVVRGLVHDVEVVHV